MFHMPAFPSCELREPKHLLMLLGSILFYLSSCSLILNALTEHCTHRLFVCAKRY